MSHLTRLFSSLRCNGRLLIAALIAFLVMSGIRAQAQDEGRPMTFFLTFVPNIQFSPLYVAIEEGFFAEEGIALTIEHGDEPDGVNLIAAGARQFGMIGGEQVIIARANQRPVVSIYKWFQRNPIAIVTPEDSGIETPADLAGRRIGLPGRFGANYSGLVALLTSAGLTETDVQLEAIGFNAPEAICLGRVEASAVYINNEPLQIATRAALGDCGRVTGVRVIAAADYANLVSNGIVTNEQTLRDEPELALAVNRAFDRGLRLTIDNPALAYLHSAEHVATLPMTPDLRESLQTFAADRARDLANGMTSRRDAAAHRTILHEVLSERFADPALLIQMQVLTTTIELWDAERLGVSDPDLWALTQEVLMKMGFLDAPIDLDAAFTNDFLPAADER